MKLTVSPISELMGGRTVKVQAFGPIQKLSSKLMISCKLSIYASFRLLKARTSDLQETCALVSQLWILA